MEGRAKSEPLCSVWGHGTREALRPEPGSNPDSTLTSWGSQVSPHTAKQKLYEEVFGPEERSTPFPEPTLILVGIEVNGGYTRDSGTLSWRAQATCLESQQSGS